MESMQANETINTRFGHQTKISRYGWSVVDSIGELRMINKKELCVDKSYQRDQLRDLAVLRIAHNWSWIACGAIVVAERYKNYFIIDGQQRVAAALKRADIKEMPCVVFKTDSATEEAVAFLRLNTERRNVRMIEKLKAMAMSGDDIARRIYEMAEDCGRVICNNSDGKSIKCVNTLYRNLKQNRGALEKVWPLILELCDGRIISERVVDAMVYLEKFGTESLIQKKWRLKVLSVGYDAIDKACVEAAAYYAKGGAKVWASGVIRVLNKGMRNKIELKAITNES